MVSSVKDALCCCALQCRCRDSNEVSENLEICALTGCGSSPCSKRGLSELRVGQLYSLEARQWRGYDVVAQVMMIGEQRLSLGPLSVVVRSKRM